MEHEVVVSSAASYAEAPIVIERRRLGAVIPEREVNR